MAPRQWKVSSGRLYKRELHQERLSIDKKSKKGPIVVDSREAILPLENCSLTCFFDRKAFFPMKDNSREGTTFRNNAPSEFRLTLSQPLSFEINPTTFLNSIKSPDFEAEKLWNGQSGILAGKRFLLWRIALFFYWSIWATETCWKWKHRTILHFAEWLVSIPWILWLQHLVLLSVKIFIVLLY